jgi:phenylalanyl-tRNA synthetase alpha chain
MSATERIAALRAEAEGAIAAAVGTGELEELRVRYLGRKAELPQLLRGVADLDPSERSAVGRAANEARRGLEALIETREAALAAAELDRRLVADRVDVTLPGDPAQPVGRLHLLTQTRREIEDVFAGLGFGIVEGPEIELVDYNFDALNHAPTHPARARSDTFYVSEDVLLRTHTSPMQVRVMEREPPPLRVIVPGRVYRPDNDATHTPQFHQIEGLAVDEGITLADLKGTLLAFARAIFGDERQVLLRPHFFPFTEPSVEVDVSCFACAAGWRPDGSHPDGHRRCALCKGSGWLEVLGAGMVDPNVFAHVERLRALRDPAPRPPGPAVYDPERVQGFAFGLGIERIAMLKHGVPDLRLFYDNDVRFLGQF